MNNINYNKSRTELKKCRMSYEKLSPRNCHLEYGLPVVIETISIQFSPRKTTPK